MKELIGSIVFGIVLLSGSLLAQQSTKDPGTTEATKIAARESVATTALQNSPGAVLGQDTQDKKAPPFDEAPVAKTHVNPKYPDAATKAGTEGTVYTQVSIDETGKVTKVVVTKSDAEIFNQPAIDAGMKWSFKPALKDGKPVAAVVSIPFRFKLSKGDEILDYSKPGASPLLVTVGSRIGYRVMRQMPYLIGQSLTPTTDWYPQSAVKDEFDGIVSLKLTINLNGRVESAEVVDAAREDLDSAAVRLARTWTFTPGYAFGMPEKTVIRVPVVFHIDRQKK
jgi:TonB family protein